MDVVNNTPALPVKKKYSIIYADPPWDYPLSGGTKKGRGLAKKQYQTMKTPDICALPVQDIATEDAVCFMWATFPNIGTALKVMESWGFRYKTAAFVWVKKNPKSGALAWGMGAYTRANAEVVLLGIRDGVKAKECVRSRKVHQIIEAPRGRHSQKPDEVRDRIVELMGDIPRIELFARSAAEGWDCWGNEAPNQQETPEETKEGATA